ncbi:hypothetical protein BO78DRAFT_443250 [Aspergillus sclerotiicarbonarius CBS 121057]|uniref:Zn(2)-C6 fungal-type domain-containing protein n=1 Tax=Aspergillus sclerotiicarbonarius (strain CBS 121057 / IBT 28362) TaxID=1448318 RepID=A0A319ECK1_ASPSB|nr:hypothetical protein BO78DRAFT_443250 [Aspergillus sclerotiicarbonarius CBS 121057]
MPRRVIAAGRSCLECSRRKIKCDRSLPCGYCVKVEITCAYPPVRRKRSRSPDAGGPDVIGRIERIEETLQVLGKGMAQIRDLLQGVAPLPTRRPEIPTPGQDESFDEDEFPGYDRPSPDYGLQGSPPGACTASCGSPEPLEELRPSPITISFLWQWYLDSVDPVLKIFHTPTVQKDVMHMVRHGTSPDLATECLLFAIYYAAVISMPSSTCQDELGDDKHTLLKRYRTGVEHTLAQLDITTTTNLTVLQAATIFLTTTRYDPHGAPVPTLLPIVITTAQRLHLHHDGTTLSLPPFETELRRLLWWHLVTLDVRTAEDHRTRPRIQPQAFTTHLPTNTPDTTLHPTMTHLPTPLPPGTKIPLLFTLLRFKGTLLSHHILFPTPNSTTTTTTPQKHTDINTFRQEIESSYLTHLDPCIPLDFITAASMRLILVKLKLTICKPRHGIPVGKFVRREGGGNYRDVCVEVLRKTVKLREYEPGKRWGWLFQRYIEWDVLVLVLVDLCAGGVEGEEDKGDGEGVWGVVERVVGFWRGELGVEGTGDERWMHIEELRGRALRVRDGTGVGRGVSVDDGDRDGDRDGDGGELTPESGLVSEKVTADVCEERDGGEELPGNGTACEWSTTAFEHYFHVLRGGDEKQNRIPREII